jgi:hypothetical protein
MTVKSRAKSLTYFQQLTLKEAYNSPFHEFDSSVSRQIKGLVKRGLLTVDYDKTLKMLHFKGRFIKVKVTAKGEAVVKLILEQGVKRVFRYT